MMLKLPEPRRNLSAAPSHPAMSFSVSRRQWVLAASAWPWLMSAQAATVEPVLNVSGKIKVSNGPQGYGFTWDMLSALPQHQFRTRTPWHAGTPQFSGPLLRTVLDKVQAQGQTLRAIGLNDYAVELPASDAAEWDVIVALLQDGRPMPVRERGPLFIIYPFDERTELRRQQYFNRSVWQLCRLEIS